MEVPEWDATTHKMIELMDSEDVRDVAMHNMINVMGSKDARDVAEVQWVVVYSNLEDARDVVETSRSRTVTVRGMVTVRVKSRVRECTFSAGIHLFFPPHSINNRLVLQAKVCQGQLDKFIISSLEREQMKGTWDKYIYMLKNDHNWTINTALLIPFHLSENPPSIVIDCCGHCHG